MVSFEIIIEHLNKNILKFTFNKLNKKIYSNNYNFFHSSYRNENGYSEKGFLNWLEQRLEEFKIRFICLKKDKDLKIFKDIKKIIIIKEL